MVYFRRYLLGRQFTLLTDQIVMKYLKSKTSPVGPLAGFVLESQEFHYDVEHIPGKDLGPPDCLSRTPNMIPDTETLVAQEMVYMTALASSLTSSTTPPSQELLCRSDWITGQLEDPGISSLRTLLLTQSTSMQLLSMLFETISCIIDIHKNLPNFVFTFLALL